MEETTQLSPTHTENTRLRVGSNGQRGSLGMRVTTAPGGRHDPAPGTLCGGAGVTRPLGGGGHTGGHGAGAAHRAMPSPTATITAGKGGGGAEPQPGSPGDTGHARAPRRPGETRVYRAVGGGGVREGDGPAGCSSQSPPPGGRPPARAAPRPRGGTNGPNGRRAAPRPLPPPSPPLPQARPRFPLTCGRWARRAREAEPPPIWGRAGALPGP